MARLISLLRGKNDRRSEPDLAPMLARASIEVTPRTAAGIEDLRRLVPASTRVYVAHIDGTAIDDMVATAARLRDEGMVPMPHIAARSIPDAETLAVWLTRYRDEAGVDQALVIAGGSAAPAGAFHSSMQLLETGLFDRFGFRSLHVAGHPEGNRDIDPDGSYRALDEALRWKQDFAACTDADVAIVTQFVFDAEPVIRWSKRLQQEGFTLPIHVGVAGPAKLQTLLKYAVACGVGPSIKVIKRRASGLGNLILPYQPTDVLARLVKHRRAEPDTLVVGAHLFPLGGIAATTAYLARHGATG